jgi:hypothetical protein
MEQVVVTIRDGNVVVEVEGVKGTCCLELTQAIENLIGKVNNQLIKKKDFYARMKTTPKICIRYFEKS